MPTSTATATATASAVLSSDTFSRNVTNGWGSADVGGPYTLSGAAGDFAVTGASGTITLTAPSANRAAYLPTVAVTDVDETVRVQTNKPATGSGQYLYLLARANLTGNEYRGKLRIASTGQVYLQATKVLTNVETSLGSEIAIPGLLYTPGTYLHLRLAVTGTNPTTLQMMAWSEGQAEPTTWAYSVADSTPSLQGAGAVGLRAYLAGGASNAPVLVSLDDFQVTPPPSSPPAPPAATSSNTYYVDCSAGNDANSGLQPTQAWQSLARANAFTLQPGDSLLFKRGCAWTGPLTASWSGTAAAPILIGAYGSGPLPTIQNAHDDVVITGSYLIFDSLYTRADPPAYDSGCDNNPMGWRVGFRFRPGSANNLLRNSEASNLYIGVLIEAGSSYNKILNNLLQNNNMKSDDLSSDSGGVAIALEGDSNEVAYNYISGSDMCSRQYGRDGAAVEVYGGHYNTIHHNTAVDNNTFVEVGLSGSSDNTIAYNSVRAYQTAASFLVVHALQDKNGPTYRTRVYNNSVYLTGSQSYAIQCVQGCSPTVLSLKNNIVWAEGSIGYADAPFDEGNNLFWNAAGTPAIRFSTSSTDLRANPQWVNPGSGDFHLQSTSPAIDQGSLDSVTAGYTSDLDGTLVPQGAGVDIGAYEFH